MTLRALNAGGEAHPSNCRQVVRQLMDGNGWSLLQEQDLMTRVQELAGSVASPGELRRAALCHYSLVLYEACCQARDRARREQAYGELFRYLYRAAYNRWPDLAEDVTQRALVLVYEQIECCREPGAFLAFALYKLRHAFQQELRARGEASLTGLEDCREQATENTEPERGQQIRTLLAAIRRLPDERQRQAILYRFFAGLSDNEIATRLGITAGHLRVLRHRGLAALRRDQQLAGDLGWLNGE